MLVVRGVIFSFCIWCLFPACNFGSKNKNESFVALWSKIDSSYAKKWQDSLKILLVDSQQNFGNIYINNPKEIFEYLNEISVNKQFAFMENTDVDAKFSAFGKFMDIHGLDSGFYHVKNINYLLGWSKLLELNKRKKLLNSAMDSLLTLKLLVCDALFAAGKDIKMGRVNPNLQETNLTPVVAKNMVVKDILSLEDPFAKIQNLAPTHKEYQLLIAKNVRLKRYSSTFLSNKILSLNLKDSSGKKILAAKLNILDTADGFNKNMDTAIKSGLTYLTAIIAADSFKLLNPNILDIINFDAELLKRKIAINLERCRWTLPITGANRVVVNIANNTLEGYLNDSLAIAMRVCTGKTRGMDYFVKYAAYLRKDSFSASPQNYETPLLNSTLSHMVVFPNWKIPKSILVKELLSKIKRNPGYIKRIGYRLMSFSGKEMDAYKVNWNKINESYVPFYLEQAGGKGNALGRIMFYFTNSHSVYCHDTPQKWAFGNDARHVSHGCVRLQHPVEFAKFLQQAQDSNQIDYVLLSLGDTPLKDTSLIRLRAEELKDTTINYKRFGKQMNKRYNLANKVPIYLVYNTVDFRKNGLITLNADGYNRDEWLENAMQRPREMTKINSKYSNFCKPKIKSKPTIVKVIKENLKEQLQEVAKEE